MPARVILLAGFILLSVAAFPQVSETDSLESLVKLVPSDTNKVYLLNRLVNTLREKDNNKALIFAQQAAELAELLGYKKGLSLAYENLGWVLYRKGDYSKSIEISTKALKISEEIGDRKAIARCQVNIAAIYYEQKQSDKAIESFQNAYKTGIEIKDYLLMARCLNNIAFTYIGLNKIDSAFQNVTRALRISERTNDPYMLAFSRRTLGDIFLSENNLKEALANFNIAHQLSEQHTNTFIKVSVLHRLGKTYALLGENDKALRYLDEDIKTAREFGFKDELERSYKLCSEIYFKKHDINRAYLFQSAYVNLHDSLYSQRNSEQIALMQIRFDTEMKQAQIELLTKDAALQVEEINQQRVWIYFYVGCLSLLLILAFVLLFNNRQNQKAKMALEEKNKAIELQAHQLRNVNASKDKLFSIISHDLRSPVASLRALMEIASNSGLTQKEFQEVSTALKRNLDTVYDDLDNLLLWAQTQLKGLQAFPEEFELRKVAEEKIDLFKNPAQAKNLKVINEIPPGVSVFADRNHVSLIFRNLLANAIKFNQPGGTITLSAEEQNDFCRISVSDSGVGISGEDIAKLFNAETHFSTPGTNKERGVGIGLLLTKEFVESNHGSISVTSKLGIGTSFTFTLKVSRQAVLA